MDDNTFGLLKFGILIVGLLAILIIFTLNRRALKRIHHPTTAPKNIAEYYDAKSKQYNGEAK